MNSNKELVFQKSNIGLGKRKQAIARVFLLPGEGNLLINKVSGDQYLQYNETYLNTSYFCILQKKEKIQPSRLLM